MKTSVLKNAEKEAWISEDYQYRYYLSRGWDGAGVFGSPGDLAFVMLNPSSADANVDDPTIRKCAGFAELWGYTGFAVYNLFALRSPSPADLLSAEDPIGPENNYALSEMSSTYQYTGGKIVVAWGTHGNLRGRAAEVLSDQLKGAPLWCLGTNANGTPKHPLYIPYSKPLIPYVQP